MDDEELLRQMLLQSMQASPTPEAQSQPAPDQPQQEEEIPDLNGGAREEGEISEDEGASTPDEDPLLEDERRGDTRAGNNTDNNLDDRSSKYITVDSDEEDYLKLLKNYEKKLDPQSDQNKDDERRNGKRGPYESVRARRSFSPVDRRRDRNTRRDSTRGRRNHRDTYYDGVPSNPAPNPAINPAFLLQSLVNFIGTARPPPGPGSVPPPGPMHAYPPPPPEPYPQPPPPVPLEPYGAGDMELDPPHYAPYAPHHYYAYGDYEHYAAPGPYPPYRMTPVTQPPRPVVAPQKSLPPRTASVTPVTQPPINDVPVAVPEPRRAVESAAWPDVTDDDRVVIDLGELDQDSEDEQRQDTEDWVLNIARIKQQLAEKEKSRARHRDSAASDDSAKSANGAELDRASDAALTDKTALVDKSTLVDKSALADKTVPTDKSALADKEQRIQRLKDEIARRERELQRKKKDTDTRDDSSVKDPDARDEARDEASGHGEKRPRSQSDASREEPAAKRVRTERTAQSSGHEGQSESEALGLAPSDTSRAPSDTSQAPSDTSRAPSDAGLTSKPPQSADQDRARLAHDARAQLAVLQHQSTQLSTEVTASRLAVLHTTASLSRAELKIAFLEEQLKAARDERSVLSNTKQERETQCHVLEQKMSEIQRDMEHATSVIAQHEHMLDRELLLRQMNSDCTEAGTAVTSNPFTTGTAVTPSPFTTGTAVTSSPFTTGTAVTSSPFTTGTAVTSSPFTTSTAVISSPFTTGTAVTSSPFTTGTAVTSSPFTTGTAVTSSPFTTGTAVTSSPFTTSTAVISSTGTTDASVTPSTVARPMEIIGVEAVTNISAANPRTVTPSRPLFTAPNLFRGDKSIVAPQSSVNAPLVSPATAVISNTGTAATPSPVSAGASNPVSAVTPPLESELRHQALQSLAPGTLGNRAERRKARRQLRQAQLAQTAAVTEQRTESVPSPAPTDTAAGSATDKKTALEQAQFSNKVRALRSALLSQPGEQVLVHDWSEQSLAHTRTVLLSGLDDHVLLATHIPHAALEPEPADYGDVLAALDRAHESDLRVPCSALARRYHSPLTMFGSYRLSAHFPRPLLTTLTYANKIDPHVILCKYDLHGTCNDDECQAQHAREYCMEPREVLLSLARYIEDPAQSRQANDSAVHALLARVTGRTVDEQLTSVIALVNDALRARDPEHRAVVFTPRHKSATTRKSAAPAPSTKRATKRHRAAPVHESEGEDVLRVDTVLEDAPLLHWDTDHALLDAAPDRYFHAHVSSRQVEQLLADQPHNIALWLQYAHTLLDAHSPLTQPAVLDASGQWLDAAQLIRAEVLGEAQYTTPHVDAALHVLARALELNRHSVALWLHYLRLFLPRAQSHAELVQAIDQGLTFTACSTNTNWYIDVQLALRDKIAATERAVSELSRDKSPALAARVSALSVELVLDSIRTEISLGYLEPARARLRGYIYHTGALPLRRLLRPEHVELVVLAHLHLALFEHVPDVTSYLHSAQLLVLAWSEARSSPALASVNRVFEDALEFAELQPHVPAALMVNYVLKEQLHEPQTAVWLAQRFLKQHRTHAQLWSVYALIEHLGAKHSSAQTIHAHTLAAYPRLFVLWFHRAMFALQRAEGTDTVLQLLAHAVLPLAGTALSQLRVTAADKSSVAVIRALFVTLLRIEPDTAQHFRPHAETLSEATPCDSDVYLWLLCCLFEMLTGPPEHVLHIVDQGTQRLTDAHHRNKLWLLYFAWHTQGAGQSLVPAFQAYLRCQARNEHELITWHQHELALDLPARDVPTLPVPLRREYAVTNHIAQLVMDQLAAEPRIQFLEQLQPSLPHNTAAHRCLARTLWSRALFTRAKSALLTSLFHNPHVPALWLDLAHTAMLQGRATDARRTLLAALRVVPARELWTAHCTLLATLSRKELATHLAACVPLLRTGVNREEIFRTAVPVSDFLFRSNFHDPVAGHH